MSRSYRHTPIIKDNRHGRKIDKRHANDKVRLYKEIKNGKFYRKVYNTWSIYDYVSYCTLKNYINWYKNGINRPKKEILLEEITNDWKKRYYWK